MLQRYLRRAQCGCPPPPPARVLGDPPGKSPLSAAPADPAPQGRTHPHRCPTPPQIGSRHPVAALDHSRLWARCRRLAAALLGPLLLAGPAQAHNPHDPVFAFALSPDFARDRTLFVSTHVHWRYTDILMSSDEGATWSKLPAGLDNLTDLTSIAVSPQYASDGTLIATTVSDGVFRYTPRGPGAGAWTRLNAGLPDLLVADSRLAAAPTGGTAAFAVMTGGGLYASEWGPGETPTPWHPLLPREARVSALALSPDFRQDTTLAAADSTGRLLISTDGGSDWTDLGQPAGAALRAIALAPDYATGGEIFATADRPGIWIGRGLGQSFEAVLEGLPAEPLNALAVSPDYRNDGTLFCTTLDRAIYKSTDRGATWHYQDTGAVDTDQAPDGNEMKGLALSPGYATDGKVFLAAFDGLFRSADRGLSWREIDTRHDELTGLAISPEHATDGTLVASTYAGRGVYASADRGASWSPIADALMVNKTLSVFDVVLAAGPAGTTPVLYAVENRDRLHISPDLGAHWESLPLPTLPEIDPRPPRPTEIAVTTGPSGGNEILLGTRWHAVLHSRDRGLTWDGSTEILDAMVTSVAMSPDYQSDGTAFAGASNGQVWRTGDFAATWKPTGIQGIAIPSGTAFAALAVSPDFATDGLVLVGTNDGLYASHDRGLSWRRSTANPTRKGRIVEQVRFSPGFARDGTCYVSVRGLGIYRSTDRAKTFARVLTGLLNRGVQFAELQLSPDFEHDSTLFGVSLGRAYRSQDGGVSWTSARIAPSSCGRPNAVRSAKPGLYLWEGQCGGPKRRISVRAMPGTEPGLHSWSGRATSDRPFSRVAPSSLEEDDWLYVPSGRRDVRFQLDTAAPDLDGFDLAIDDTARVCFGGDLPAGTEVLVGAEAQPVHPPFDLTSFERCTPRP
jgi:photosystem II stability/assembly factor-like uncharacterized protein